MGDLLRSQYRFYRLRPTVKIQEYRTLRGTWMLKSNHVGAIVLPLLPTYSSAE